MGNWGTHSHTDGGSEAETPDRQWKQELDLQVWREAKGHRVDPKIKVELRSLDWLSKAEPTAKRRPLPSPDRWTWSDQNLKDGRPGAA